MLTMSNGGTFNQIINRKRCSVFMINFHFAVLLHVAYKLHFSASLIELFHYIGVRVTTVSPTVKGLP